MKRVIIAGNWKLDIGEGGVRAFIGAIAPAAERVMSSGRSVVVCPPDLHLVEAVAAARDTAGAIAIGGQDCHHRERGAYTGETSPAMLAAIGAAYVIIGHSERRTLFGETDRGVNLKARAALAAGLVPILCVGESLAERDAGIAREVVEFQIQAALTSVDGGQTGRLVIAYEPVWAIGTGRTATPGQAQEMHAAIREWLVRRFDPVAAAGIPLLYGGSVKPDNISALLGCADIDGVLVGGASLKQAGFAAIIEGQVGSNFP